MCLSFSHAAASREMIWTYFALGFLDSESELQDSALTIKLAGNLICGMVMPESNYEQKHRRSLWETAGMIFDSYDKLLVS